MPTPKTDRGHVAYARHSQSGKVSFIGWKVKRPTSEHLVPPKRIEPGAEMIIKTPEGMNSRLGNEFSLKVIGKDKSHYHVKVTHSTGKTQIGKEYAIEHQSLHDAVKTAKVFVPAHQADIATIGTSKISQGDKVRYKIAEDGITYTRKGTAVRPMGRNLWVVQGAAQGATAQGEMHAVSLATMMTETEYRAKKDAKTAGTGKFENAGGSRNVLTTNELNRRADVAATRTTINENEFITSPAFQRQMGGTITGLAASNHIAAGDMRSVGGIMMSDDNFEYNDLVSDYLMGATQALRRELAAAPEVDIASFEAHMAGEEEGSRIFKVVTKEGRNAVVASLKARKEHHKRMNYIDEDNEDIGDDSSEVGDGGAWWENNLDAFDPEMQAQLEKIRRREQSVAALVGDLTPVEQEVLNRKYGLGKIVEPQSALDIAQTLKRKKVDHPLGKEWTHVAIKPVHDAAIKRLQGKTNIDSYREFLRSLKDHLDMIKSMGAVKIIAPGVLLRGLAGKHVITFATPEIAAGTKEQLIKSRPDGVWIEKTAAGSAFMFDKGSEMDTTELRKSIGLAESMLKSHVKEYTRTTASGATVQVKEHDDSRTNQHIMHDEMNKQLPTGHKIISSNKNKLVVSTGDNHSIIYETKKMREGFNRLYVSVNDGEKIHEVVSLANPEKKDMSKLVRNSIEDTSDEIARQKRKKEALKNKKSQQ